MCASIFSCLIVFTLPRAPECNMLFLFFTKHIKHVKFCRTKKKKNTNNKYKTWAPQAIHSDSNTLRCDLFPLSLHTHRRCTPGPLWGGVSLPQTEHTPRLRPAPALPEELRPEPLRRRGGARPSNKRSAQLPPQSWLITNTLSSPFKES